MKKYYYTICQVSNNYESNINKILLKDNLEFYDTKEKTLEAIYNQLRNFFKTIDKELNNRLESLFSLEDLKLENYFKNYTIGRVIYKIKVLNGGYFASIEVNNYKNKISFKINEIEDANIGYLVERVNLSLKSKKEEILSNVLKDLNEANKILKELKSKDFSKNTFYRIEIVDTSKISNPT